MAMTMALKQLKLGQLVMFKLEDRDVHGCVAREPLGLDPDALIVDTTGQLYDRLPAECDHLPRGAVPSVKRATTAIMRSAKFKRQMKSLSGHTGRRVRIHRTVVKSPGLYGDTKRGFVGPNKFGGTVRGSLSKYDIPEKMTEGFTSNLTNHMVRRLLIAYGSKKDEQLRKALNHLETTHPVRADVFTRVHMGGRPWSDGNGRILDGPQSVSDIARLRGTTPQAVSMTLKRAIVQLHKQLGWDPRRHVNYGRVKSNGRLRA